jgi:selenophosphate synthase
MAQTAYEFLANNQSQLVKFLDRNHDVSAFIAGLLGHLVEYANHKGVKFEDIRIELPRIEDAGGDQSLVARISYER